MSLKFQKAASKIEDFLALPCWLSQGRKVCWKISQLQSKCCYNKHWFVDLHKHGVKRMHCLLSLKRATFYLIQIHTPHFVDLRLLGTSDVHYGTHKAPANHHIFDKNAHVKSRAQTE